MFTRIAIHTSSAEAQRFILEVSKVLPATFRELRTKAWELCPELKTYCEANQQKLVGNDKGSAGKLVEFYIFGKTPNCDSTPDLTLGDIKATHVKAIGDSFNAKERLTLTNVGSTGNYDTLNHILDSEILKESKSYSKVRNGIMAVLVRNKSRPTMEEVLDEKVVALFSYDLENLPQEMQDIVNDDYAKIRNCVKEKAVSQKGQQYLHIHPHGSKGSKTRALGFTNKFVTTLICHSTGRKLVKKGASWMFNI
jgi:hypothetical protein